MKHLFLTLVAASAMQMLQAQAGYKYEVDLTSVANDKLTVNLAAPAVTGNEVLFKMPKIVPGTYSIYDFGRYVSNFQAFDKIGNPLPVEHTDENTWKIGSASNLGRISYEVDDTWDSDEIAGTYIFEPAGTNFDAGKNFVLNTHAVFGYFEGNEETTFQVDFTRSSDFYPASAQRFTTTGNIDHFTFDSYFRLADNPIIYSKADTATIQVGNAEVVIGVYNGSGKIKASFIKEQVQEVLNAQKDYLGGTLPVDRYAFLMYFTDEPSFSGGALEHNNSSLYYFTAGPPESIAQLIKDVSAHEFFHIVTPLTLHSEEIRFFNFGDPKMSKHLWLYEGCTEYFAHHAQVKGGLITLDEYAANIAEKIGVASNYNDTVAFTFMSQNCLSTYKDQYLNVYQKGALIGMYLDIRIRELSSGSMGLMDVLQKLSQKYGRDKPFKDDELFDEIEALSYPEIGTFLRTYVGGNLPFPTEEMLNWVGLVEKADEGGGQQLPDMGISLTTGISLDESRAYLKIVDAGGITENGKKMKIQVGDVIKSIDGDDMSVSNIESVIMSIYMKAMSNAKFEMVVLRQKGKKLKEVKLKGQFAMMTMKGPGSLGFTDTPTPEQQQLRQWWLGK